MLYIIPVLNLLGSRDERKTQYKNEATCVSFLARLEGAEGFQDACTVEES